MPTIDFTAQGADQWTKPEGVTEFTVELIGGGGAGRGAGGLNTQGGGGGGGAAALREFTGQPSAATDYALFVGAGGAGQSGPEVPGGTGSASWFDSTSSVFAAPGVGAQGQGGGAGGLASASVGDTTVSGQNGGTAGGQNGVGGNAASVGTLTGGTGGPFPGAAGNPGGPGTQPGGGGSGSWSVGFGGQTVGGDGAVGWVRVTYDEPGVVTSGAATGNHTWTATADGETVTSGIADGTHTWTATADGETATSGVATGDHTWVATADGETVTSGIADGTHTWMGAVGGTAGSGGIVAGNHTWAGTAEGTTERTGSVTAEHIWEGTAVSTQPIEPRLSAATAALQVLQDLLDLLDGPEAPCPLVPPACRVGVAPGAEVAWDTCGESACSNKDGQLWAALQPFTVVQSGGSCLHVIWTAEIGVVRCAATLADDGSPPRVEAVAADAFQQAQDADAILDALRCCQERNDAIRDLEATSWTPLGPEGGCVGGAWAIQGSMDICC